MYGGGGGESNSSNMVAMVATKIWGASDGEFAMVAKEPKREDIRIAKLNLGVEKSIENEIR